MAITQGITGSAQVPAAGAVAAFDPTINNKVISTIAVHNKAAATGAALVRIDRLHGTTGGASIEPGQTERFQVNNGEVDIMYISGTGGIVNWYPVEATRS